MTLLLWLHLLGGIVVTGLALFWAIMGRSLTTAQGPAEARRLLAVTTTARWPHVGLPWKLRLPLPLLSAAALLVVAFLGFLLPAGFGIAIVLKSVASFAMLVCFLALARRPSPEFGYAALALAVVATALSPLLGR